MTEDCPICYEELRLETKTTRCNHTFHKECLEEWLRSESICPLCRNEYPIEKPLSRRGGGIFAEIATAAEQDQFLNTNVHLYTFALTPLNYEPTGTIGTNFDDILTTTTNTF